MITVNENPAARGDAQAGLDDCHRRLASDNRVYRTKSAFNQAQYRARLKFLARRLHGLGERPLYHFLDEVAHGADLLPHLERYAALPAAFIKAHGGDRFAPAVHVIDGGRP